MIDYEDPNWILKMTLVEAVADFEADVFFDYIPISAALSKYSTLLEVLTYNVERTHLQKIQVILTNAHSAMMRKIARAELHVEINGNVPRLPQ